MFCVPQASYYVRLEDVESPRQLFGREQCHFCVSHLMSPGQAELAYLVVTHIGDQTQLAINISRINKISESRINADRFASVDDDIVCLGRLLGDHRDRT